MYSIKYKIYKVINKFFSWYYYRIPSLHKHIYRFVRNYEHEIWAKQRDKNAADLIDRIKACKGRTDAFDNILTNDLAIELALQYINTTHDWQSWEDYTIVAADGIIVRGNNQEIHFDSTGEIYNKFIDISNDNEHKKALTSFRKVTMKRLCAGDLDCDIEYGE